jgi:hypothetical protein
MKNSTLVIFSIIKNIENFIKEIPKGKDVDIFKTSHIIVYKKSSKFYTENSKRIYSDIENGYYSLKDFIIFLLYKNMMGEKVNFYKIKSKEIINDVELFTKKRLNKDLELLKVVYEKLNFKGIEDYFHIKEDGTNIIYVLIKTKKISPIFFIRNFEKFLTNEIKNDIIKNKEFKQFVMIALKIKETLKRRF